MNEFATRMLRAAKLDPTLYEEVEADKTTMTQALTVVLLSGFASGISGMGRSGLGGLLGGTLWGIVAWLVGSLIMYFVGTRWFADENTEADYGQLLRTLGFAASPGLMRVVGIIGPLRWLAFWGTSIWMIATMVLAVRQALDYSTTSRAVIVCLIGFVIQIIVGWVFLVAGCGGIF
ncbi:MAG: hypothetical protein MUE60_01050 [Candidatus Eisenbacteria bacterium]|jgi:hypothetical protein|nr:hypothetical protein [Candidatus Eisenbacteria bacterium]